MSAPEDCGLRCLLPFDDSDDEGSLPPKTTVAATEACVSTFDVAGRVQLLVRTEASEGTGFQIWPAAHSILSFFQEEELKKPGTWRGKRVLELGAGCGLAGLAISALGGHVTLTDLPIVLRLLQSNAEANASAVARAGGTVAVAPLAWGNEQHTAELSSTTWDVILCADVVYRRELFTALALSLSALCSPSTLVIFAHLKRWGWERDFWRLLRTCNFSALEEVWSEKDTRQRRPVRIFTCKRAGG